MRACAEGEFACYYECGRSSAVGHHINDLVGMGQKDHRVEAVAPCCFNCHTNHHAKGKKTWAEKMKRPVLTLDALAEWEGKMKGEMR